jgi:hypothetical protein
MGDECIHGMDPTWCATCNGADARAARGHGAGYGFYGGETKQDLLYELCDLLGLPRQPIGVGSSLPSDVFEAAADRAGVRRGSMPEIGRAIARKAGKRWGSDCDSTGSISGGGSTVTAVGLRVMIDSFGVL